MSTSNASSSSTSSGLTSSNLGSPLNSLSSKPIRKRKKKRRGSGGSNASIISIDQVSLSRLRRNHERATNARRKQKEAYKQQKQSRFENLSKTYANELKEGQSDDDHDIGGSSMGMSSPALSGLSSYDTALQKRRTFEEYTNYDSSSSKERVGNGGNGSTASTMEEITADELLPLLKSMVDQHQELQENYDRMELEYKNTERSLKMVLNDEITSLKQQNANLPLSPDVFDTNLDANTSQLLQDLLALHKDIQRAMHEQYTGELEQQRRNWENDLLQSQYQHDMDNQDVESMNKKVAELNRENDDLVKECDHLRQSLEQVQESLRVSLNERNKQSHAMHRLKKEQNSLKSEYDSLRQLNRQMQQELEQLYQEQEQREDMLAQSTDRRSSVGSGHLLTREQTLHIGGGDRRPQTPTHHYTRTIVSGTSSVITGGGGGGHSGNGAENGSNRGLSDHDSSGFGGTDLMHQIGDQYGDAMGGDSNDQYDSNTPDANHRPKSSRQSSSDPPDRGSNYGDDAPDEVKHHENGPTPPLDADDEKKTKEDHHDPGMSMSPQGVESVVAQLARFKNIGAAVSDLSQIRAMLQDKEVKRIQPNGHSQPSQEVQDDWSDQSNYSESEAKLEEQIDILEDEIRELKVAVQQLIGSTDRITPHITYLLSPLTRKINRMYLMLNTGPMESHTAVIDEEASMAGIGSRAGSAHSGRRGHHRHSQYDNHSDSEEWNDLSSQHSTRTKSTVAYQGHWIGWITPWLHDWMPSLGFSAILLSSMYLMFKWQNGGRIYGKPQVLRGRH